MNVIWRGAWPAPGYGAKAAGTPGRRRAPHGAARGGRQGGRWRVPPFFGANL